jgi:predicted component of type VI protein secretion system
MKLVIEDEAGTKSTVPFAGTEITVGRGSEGVTYRLADRNVSRRHARFVLVNGAVFVEDLGSLTGTRVNGDPIVGRRKVRQGDLVQIGDYDLVVAGQANGAAEKDPPPLPATQPGMPPVGALTGGSLLADRALVRRLAAVALGALLVGAAAGWLVGRLTLPRAGPEAHSGAAAVSR